MGYFSDNVDLIVSGGGFSKGYRIPWEDPNSGVHIHSELWKWNFFWSCYHLKIMDNKYIYWI